jgi:hypothetical protein
MLCSILSSKKRSFAIFGSIILILAIGVALKGITDDELPS